MLTRIHVRASNTQCYLLVGMALIAALAASVKDGLTQTAKRQVLYVEANHPMDSRGEPIYKMGTVTSPGESEIPGVLVAPVALKTPKPKYPESLKKIKSPFTLIVDGVVAENGDFIDVTVATLSSPEITETTLNAVQHWKFKPATLDSKPIAMHTRAEVKYRVW